MRRRARSRAASAKPRLSQGISKADHAPLLSSGLWQLPIGQASHEGLIDIQGCHDPLFLARGRAGKQSLT
eukprot:5577558-Pyramimonas_sp.AAC.1